jgi:hypothetical protein
LLPGETWDREQKVSTALGLSFTAEQHPHVSKMPVYDPISIAVMGAGILLAAAPCLAAMTPVQASSDSIV